MIRPATTRPALRYFGAKSKLAPWIISHFPPHRSYCEPFGGGANVLLQKERAPVETYNDLDGRVVNFFRVLRARAGELVGLLELTPYARAEFELALEPCPDDPLEDARRFFVAAWMSIGGPLRRNTRGNWRYIKSVTARTGKSPAGYWHFDHLYAVAERLMGVQIECRDALYLIPHMDTTETLHYLDPPYVLAERSRNDHLYTHDMADADHERLAGIARELEGYCIISGYPSELYADLYELHGWERRDTQARVNSSRTNREAEAVRTESIWLNPRCAAELQGNLFWG